MIYSDTNLIYTQTERETDSHTVIHVHTLKKNQY